MELNKFSWKDGLKVTAGGLTGGLLGWLATQAYEAFIVKKKENAPKEETFPERTSTSQVATATEAEVAAKEEREEETEAATVAELEDVESDVEDETVEDDPYYVDSRYNEFGFDCAGYSQQYYRATVDGLLNRICKAGKQMQAGNYEYAVFDARYVTDSGLKMLLRHNGLGTGRLEENIDECRENGLISKDMAEHLHHVRRIGNFNEHSDFAPYNLTHNQAFFSIMQTLDLISVIEIQLLWPEPLPELAAFWSNNSLTEEDLLTEGNDKEV